MYSIWHRPNRFHTWERFEKAFTLDEMLMVVGSGDTSHEYFVATNEI